MNSHPHVNQTQTRKALHSWDGKHEAGLLLKDWKGIHFGSKREKQTHAIFKELKIITSPWNECYCYRITKIWDNVADKQSYKKMIFFWDYIG